jgi:hypothetical protein
MTEPRRREAAAAATSGARRAGERPARDAFELELDLRGVARDPLLEQYVRTVVGFALWHHEVWVRRVLIRLERAAGAARPGPVRCGIRAELARGPAVEAGVIGADVHEAVTHAADLAELTLLRRRGLGRSGGAGEWAA